MGKPGTKLLRLGTNSSAPESSHLEEHQLKSFCQHLASSMRPEEAYRAAIPIQHRKKLGQFFTPLPIAEIMVDWIAAVAPKAILDPAVGPGVFPELLLKTIPQARIVCLDIDSVALKAAKLSLGNHKNVDFWEQDFLTWSDDRLFDAAIVNPPYLRHHDIYYPYDIHDLIGKKNQIRLSRLSNIYVLFILELCRRLRPGGRAAAIIPGEWVNANFGVSLKYWLIKQGLLHTLLYFSHAASQFEEALTTASILLLERPVGPDGRDSVRTIFLPDCSDINGVRQLILERSADSGRHITQDFDPLHLLSEKKWNHLLSHGQGHFKPGYVRLSELATTRRGIATGCNSFFHLSATDARKFAIRTTNLLRCIGRASDVKGVIYSSSDYEKLEESGAKCLLFSMHDAPNERESDYISKGEAAELHRRYLCAVRSQQWYTMEKRPPSAIWAAVFGRKQLRFIHNTSGIANLTTFHCVYPRFVDHTFVAALAACLNSQLIQNLAKRQQRVYGAGLLKIEPKDLLDIQVPDLRQVSKETLRNLEMLLGRLNQAMRAGRDLDEANAELDSIVKKAGQEAAARGVLNETMIQGEVQGSLLP